jgi:hypothetical protein
MDQWTTRYIEEWQADFGEDEPGAESSLRFVKDVLAALKELLPAEKVPMTSHETIASSVATSVNLQPSPKDSLQYFEEIISEAATASALEPGEVEWYV